MAQMTQRDRLLPAVLGVAAVVLLVAGVVALIVADFDDSGSATSAPAGSQPSGPSPSSQQGGPPPPITDACSLVTLDAVAAAIGAKPAEVKPEPGTQTLGPKCDFKAPEGEDVLTGFTLQVTDAGDPTFARATIEGRTGKRVPIGDVAVLEQRDAGSTISVVKGSRYVQLQSRRKAVSDDAMIGLGRQAAEKL
ncbi:MAG: hypothetical protein M3404_10710 [Actinomycetota bacterium]|nr:hypothetical protein [Actinomycetota bacterium]